MPKLHCKKSNFEGARAFPVFAKSEPFQTFRLIWRLYLGRKGNFQTLGGQTLKIYLTKHFKHVSIISIPKTCIILPIYVLARAIIMQTLKSVPINLCHPVQHFAGYNAGSKNFDTHCVLLTLYILPQSVLMVCKDVRATTEAPARDIASVKNKASCGPSSSITSG